MSEAAAYRRINKHRPFLELLQSAEKNQQQALLKTATNEQIRILSEIVLNILIGNIPLTQKTKNNFSRYKDKLRELSDQTLPSETLKKKWNKFSVEILETVIKIVFKFFSDILLQ